MVTPSRIPGHPPSFSLLSAWIGPKRHRPGRRDHQRPRAVPGRRHQGRRHSRAPVSTPQSHGCLPPPLVQPLYPLRDLHFLKTYFLCFFCLCPSLARVQPPQGTAFFPSNFWCWTSRGIVILLGPSEGEVPDSSPFKWLAWPNLHQSMNCFPCRCGFLPIFTLSTNPPSPFFLSFLYPLDPVHMCAQEGLKSGYHLPRPGCFDVSSVQKFPTPLLVTGAGPKTTVSE